MSVGRGYRDLRLIDADPRGSPSPHYDSATIISYGSDSQRSGLVPGYDSLPRNSATFIRSVDPAYTPRNHSNHIIYRTEETHQVVDPRPPDSPPPPYSAVRVSPINMAERGERMIRVQTDFPVSAVTGGTYRGNQGNIGRYGSPVNHNYQTETSMRTIPIQVQTSGYRNENTPPPSVQYGGRSSRSGSGERVIEIQRPSQSPRTVQVQGGLQQRSPSPYQERNDIETMVPAYTAAYSHHGDGGDSRYPQGASSKIVYTVTPQGQGQVQSHPMHQRSLSPGAEARPPTPPRSPLTPGSLGNQQSPVNMGRMSPLRVALQKGEQGGGAAPRPYQLKPTMDKHQGDGFTPPTLLLPRQQQPGNRKSDEVDTLTNLLLQNLDTVGDPDFCGMCAKCGHAIMGEMTGCTALDQCFHIACFTCDTCQVILKGRPFFAMDGKPYCEACYLNSLEKCSVCSKAIMDRILRATGKPYHPRCFSCVVCDRSLDGVPFTVDATNQIHCIEDFHKKFAPRCAVCEEPILPDSASEETVRIVALDRSFHVACYCCEDCGVRLSSETDGRGCYPLDHHILCKSCNANRIRALTTNMTTEL